MLREYSLTDEPDSFFEQTKGRIYSAVSRFFSKKESSYRVKTKTAIVGVKGTEFTLEANTEDTQLWVSEGIVELGSIDPEIEEVVVVYENQTARVELGKPPTQPESYVSNAQSKAKQKKKQATKKAQSEAKTQSTTTAQNQSQPASQEAAVTEESSTLNTEEVLEEVQQAVEETVAEEQAAAIVDDGLLQNNVDISIKITVPSSF